MSSLKIRRIVMSALLLLEIVMLIVASTKIMPLDKSQINTIFSVLNRIPLEYYASLMLYVANITLSYKIEKKTLTLLLITLLPLYVEFPRLIYVNAFQMEYFHQAQIYHVLNTGMVTDSFYPFPRSDVAHSIMVTAWTMISGLHADLLVSHIAPIYARLSLVLITIASVYAFLKDDRIRRLALITMPIVILVADTEPTVMSHYTYALPLYMLSAYRMLSKDLRNWIFIVPLISSALAVTHIYFSTLVFLALLITAIVFLLCKGKSHMKVSTLAVPLAAFILWHGYASEWSIHMFYSELKYVLTGALDRLLAFQLNPFAPITTEPYRAVLPPTPGYKLMLYVKYVTTLLAISSVTLLTILTVLSRLNNGRLSRRTLIQLVLEMLREPYTVLLLMSAVFLVVYGITWTAHTQRVLEGFIIPYAILPLWISTRVERKTPTARIFPAKATSIIIIAILVSATIIVPLKVLSYWSTSQTYIGFSNYWVSQLEYLYNNIDSVGKLYFIGLTPYWMLTEVLPYKYSRYIGYKFSVESINDVLWNVTSWRINIDDVLSKKNNLVIIDLTTASLPMRSKFICESELREIANIVLNYASSKGMSVVYMNNQYTFIGLA